MTNWELEFGRWAPELRYIAYKGNPNTRKNLQSQMRPGSYHVLLTTYEYIIKDRPILAKTRWAHMSAWAMLKATLTRQSSTRATE